VRGCRSAGPFYDIFTETYGQLIRFVSSHEVGHTWDCVLILGPPLLYAEQLRDPEFLKANGHTHLFMDYSRFNFVAQPEDNIPQELLCRGSVIMTFGH
jgi:hypothetical protein